MGSEWQEKSFGELFSVKHGFAFKGEHFIDEPTHHLLTTPGNFAIGGGFQNTKPKFYDGPVPEDYVLNVGDVVVTMTDLSKASDTLGNAALIPEDENTWLHNQRVGLLEFHDEKAVDARFICYLFRSNEYRSWIVGSATGTTVKHTSPSRIAEFSCPVPSLPEQKAIAHILGTLDDKIELNRRMNATLEGMAQALFKSWFVDFDPVIDNALAAGNPIPDELAARAEVRRQALANGTANREAAKPFPAAFQKTEAMGWIPEGWNVSPLDKIARYQNGMALQKFRPANGETPLPIVKIAQLKTGEATWDEVASPSIKPECILDNGDVVFSWSGSLMVTLWCGGKAALNQHLFKVTSENFPKWFFLHWTKKHLADFQRIAADKAVTMGHIKRSHLTQAMCLIPPDDLIAEGSQNLAPIIERLVSNELEAKTLARLRDTLLPKLISGELRVPQAEQMIDNAP